MLGIPKYNPKYFSDAISFLKKNKDFLLQALDKKINSYYLQWNTEFEFHDTNECLSLTNGLDCNVMNLKRTEENKIYRRIQVKH